MGKKPCCVKVGLNRGTWTPQEDQVLLDYIKVNGEEKWSELPKRAGLKRCGKSCRLRWLNYLDPRIVRGNISPDEENVIISLHKLLGNRWSLIAGRLPGRTDNEIKNYWKTILYKKVQAHDHFYAPPKRKSRNKSNASNSIPLQSLVQPTNVTCREVTTVATPKTVPSYDNNIGLVEETTQNDINTEAPQRLDDVMTESGSRETSVADIDKYLQLLLDEDITSLSWDKEIPACQDTSSELAFSSHDSMFRYLRENQNNSFDPGPWPTLFESQQWP